MADYKIPGEWMRDGMILRPATTNSRINQIESLEMEEGDVIIASYPKTGTTWIQELVWLLYNEGDINKAKSASINERVPYLEFKSIGIQTGLDLLLQQSHPYLMKTHLRSNSYHNQIDAGKVKIIIGIRNPKDTLVSFYHFYRMNRGLGNFNGSWDDFFELYKAKRLLYGDYFQWYSSWLPYKDKPNIQLVKYEDMHRRMSDVIKELSRFLGKSLSERATGDVIKHLSFENMSRNDMVNFKDVPIYDIQISPFFRKGIIGDWKNYFSDEQVILVDKPYKDIIESFRVTLEFE